LHYKIVLGIGLIFSASRSHSGTSYPVVGLLWTSDQPDTETSLFPAGFETATPESERPLGLSIFSTNMNTMLET